MTPSTSPDDAGANETAEVLDERWIKMIDAALKLQAPAASAYVRRLRAKKPEASEDELIEHVCRRFRLLMTATGAGIGGTAAIPGIGTIAAVGLTIGEGATFAEACAFLTLSVAAIRGVNMKDGETRRMVMFGVLSGEKGAEIIGKALGKQGTQWGAVVTGGASNGFLARMINTQVSKYVKRRLLARFGKMWFARLAPFGIGAVIGGIGSRLVARSVTDAVRTIFADVSAVGGGTAPGGQIDDGAAAKG